MPLANRLRESEALVQQRDIDLANLNELNEFIVQHLRESILVVDTDDRVRLINETAARLLNGGPVGAGSLLGEVSPRLLYLLDTWRHQESDRRDSTGEVVSADGGTVIRPHFVSLAETGSGPVLVFLEDTSVVAERVQQSKLASLGRLSASIAHEIRNPVGAMSHAGQLLRESPGARCGRPPPHGHHREERGPGESHHRERAAAVAAGDDAAGAHLAAGVARNVPAGIRGHGPGRARFVPAAAGRRRDARCSSTRPICTRCSGTSATIRSSTRPDGSSEPVVLRTGRIASTGRPYVEVVDRGIGIDPANAERIFEPFFTDKAGGTGLGLFISRELCQTNGALLAYESRPGGGSIFRVIFADPQRWE